MLTLSPGVAGVDGVLLEVDGSEALKIANFPLASIHYLCSACLQQTVQAGSMQELFKGLQDVSITS